jgi:hypothetical protein
VSSMDFFMTNADMHGVIINVLNIIPDVVAEEANKVIRLGRTRNRLILCRIPHEM